MNKLTIKELAPYLPYGLRAKNCFNEMVEIKGLQYGNQSCRNEMWTFVKNKDYLQGYLYQCTPILRPLSDLTEEIDVNGVKFVPYDRIKSLYSNTPQFTEYKETWIDMYGVMSSKCEYVCVQKLFEWHFDVFDLRRKGLCIYYNEI